MTKTRSTRRARAAVAAALTVITVGFAAGSPNLGRADTPSPADTRQRLALPAGPRDQVLAEMRHMLESVNGILGGLADGDMRAVEKAARASGMAAAGNVNPQIRQRLPQAFLKLGMGTHKAFDALADTMAAGGTREDALRGLTEITSRCVSCHATYRLDEAPH
ncbi:MAG TPA: hypothetical protein VF406_03430 [Thermodesulfobacteriota bacterium]